MNNCQVQIVESLVLKASEMFDIPATELKGKSKKEEYCIARSMVWVACKVTVRKITLRSLGAYFDRDHKTIHSGIRNMTDEMEVNHERRLIFKELVNA